MKTLKEIKSRYKNALTVKDTYSDVVGSFDNMDERGIHEWFNAFWICDKDVNNICLYDNDRTDEGFAKILSSRDVQNRENKNPNPIFYKNAEEMDKPLSQLMEELRNDISKIRGKLGDIKKSYGWADRIEHIEGGLTCMLSTMYYTMEQWKEFEERQLKK